MGDNEIAGQEGGNPLLPLAVENAHELARFVELWVKAGFRTWPLPMNILAKWRAPVLHQNRWLVGDEALRWHWHLFIMGRIKDQFPAYVSAIEGGFTLSRRNPERGVLVVVKPIPAEELLNFLESEGLIKKVNTA
jgi:hypothetical protein